MQSLPSSRLPWLMLHAPDVMIRFPYITDELNELFNSEKDRWDYVLLRPVVLVVYFFVRCIVMPLKFVFHRFPLGFEGFLIDWTLCLGMKYLARREAVELLIRHVQIEPLVYRFLLTNHPAVSPQESLQQFNGIDADFSVNSIREIYRNNMTVGHDQLSYEIGDRFDKQIFLDSLSELRTRRPGDHNDFSKRALDEVDRHSFQILGPTNVVMLIVFTITVFADLKTAMKALNSFDSDAIVLWCMKQLYHDDQSATIDLDFFMHEMSNRGHYRSSAFFSNPSQYLYSHVVFDEIVYKLLRERPAGRCEGAA